MSNEILMLLFTGISAIIAVISAIIAGITAKSALTSVQLAKEERDEYKQLLREEQEAKLARQHADLFDQRRIFWNVLEKAYNRFNQKNVNAPDTLHKLLSAVGLPPDIYPRNGRNLKLWPIENISNLDSDQRRLLWSFTTSIYPSKKDGQQGDIMEYSCISNGSGEAFHEARGKLAHFWEKWGYSSDLSYLSKKYISQKQLLSMLSWFDIALKQWTGDDDEGKIGLFKMAQEVYRL